MHLYRLASHKTLLLILYNVISLTTTQQISLQKRSTIEGDSIAASEAANDYPKPSSARSHVGPPLGHPPFIVLMSDDTVSVAQLPMIVYGNLTDIYQLDTEELHVQDVDLSDSDDDEASEDGGNLEIEREDLRARTTVMHQHELRSNADAREYEQQQQMPQTTNVNTTTSLGKSEWQQIAVGGHGREEVLLRAEEGGAGNRKEAAAAQEGEHDTEGGQPAAAARQQLDGQTRERQQRRERRRRRRSNSLGDYDDDSASSNSASKTSASERENNTAAAAASGAQTSRSDASTAEESSSDMQNVTSAPSNVGWSEQQQQRHSRKQEEANLESPLPLARGANAPTEDGDKTGTSLPYPSSSVPTASHGAPQYPPSNRVRFSDFDVHMALGYAFVADSAGRIHRFKLASGPRSSSSSSSSSSGHTLRSNDIGGGSNVFGENSAVSENDATANSIGNSSGSHLESVASSPANRDAYEDGYSNRIGSEGRTTKADGATHEQFENERQHPTVSGGGNGGRSVLSNSAGLLVSGQTSSVGGQNRADVPRIIWSRGKFVRPAENGASLAKQQQQLNQRVLANSGRASPATDDNHGHLLSDGDAQLPRAGNSFDDDQLRSDEHQREPASGCAALKSAIGGRQASRTRHSQASLRTELAVDWLNNLLFVLDKCRLLVMDLEGNNELVLIDDFNANNRPAEIKVDPINGFLFWLQVGKFHNTIYKLNLRVLDMPSASQQLNANVVRLRQSASALANNNDSNFDYSDLVALVSHHYAHPIITNLPRHTKLFTLDHEHSKIYVPLSLAPRLPPASPNEIATNSDSNKARDDAEVFAPASDQRVTHLNNTADETLAVVNCSQPIGDPADELSASEGQILAYNIDGTDAGPLRTLGARSHINSLDDMQDLTLDSASGLLYWLTNLGRDLFEELRENSSTIQPAQHYLGGRSYTKLLYFDGGGANQPRNQRPQFNMRAIVDRVASSISSNRTTRSGERTNDPEGNSMLVLDPELKATGFSRNAPYIILGVTCLIVTSVYLVYALIFQRIQRDQSEAAERDHGARGGGSISGGSSLGSESHMDAHSSRFVHSTTMKWVAGPASGARNDLGAPLFDNRNANSFTEYDLGSSSTYGQTNAVDQHYRQDGATNTGQLFADSEASRLANLSTWPSNMRDLSNTQYVPIEVSQDDALNSIRRVSREQLIIDHGKEPLGLGHFGKVLQGTIKCTADEKYYLLERSQLNHALPGRAAISPDSLAPVSRVQLFAPSTVSSGHGSSSSTSCEFATANTLTERTSNDDYLTPKTQLNSTSSDYNVDMLAECSRVYSGYQVSQLGNKSMASGGCAETKLRVAVKLLKDNASPNDERDFLQEAKLLAKFDHPNIVRLIGICLDRGATFIVMELMLGGDLIRYMQANIPRPDTELADILTYDDLLKICLDIANGCCYLEDNNHIHRDLAARNCLVSSRKREERIVKLADFGLARDIYKDDYYTTVNKDSAMPLKWMAPECLWEQKFSMKSDVWSFGVVMWEVMSYCLEKPHDPIPTNLLKEYLSAGNRPKQPVGCDDNMYKLMCQCWQLEPSDRPTFHECRAMLIELRNNGKL